MKLSAQEEYGLRCLLQIGRLGEGGSLTIPEISRLEGISVHHAAKILQILRQEGYLKSARGQTGGYTLARLPEVIVVGDVLAAMGGRLYEEEFCSQHSGLEASCTHTVGCSIRSLWRTVQEAVDGVLSKTTLHDLLEREREIHSVPDALVGLQPPRPATPLADQRR